MATEIYLGYPPENIKNWIEKNWSSHYFTINNEIECDSFKEAIETINNSSQDENIIRLNKDIILDDIEETSGAILPLISKNLILDLNNKKMISHNIYSINGTRFLKSDGIANVTIKNGTFNGDFICNVEQAAGGFFRQCSSGTFTLDNVDVQILKGRWCTSIKCENGNVIIKDSSIKQYGANACVGADATGVKVDINNSTLESIFDENAMPGFTAETGRNNICNTINVCYNATLNVSNSIIKGIDTTACIMSMNSGGNITLSACNIEYIRKGEKTNNLYNGNGCCLYGDANGDNHATFICYDCTMKHPGLFKDENNIIPSDNNLQMIYSTVNSGVINEGAYNTFIFDGGTYELFNILKDRKLVDNNILFDSSNANTIIKSGTFIGKTDEFSSGKFEYIVDKTSTYEKINDTQYIVHKI